MHLLLIHRSPGVLGGVETLVARMTRWLVAHGHRVTLLVESTRDWGDLVPREVRTFALEDRFRLLFSCLHARRLCRSLGIKDVDVIKSFNVPTAWIAWQLANFGGWRCKVIAGLYNPSVFRVECAADPARYWDDKNLHVKTYLDCIPENARVFCSVDQLDDLREAHQQSGLVWPLPIDASEFLPAPRAPVPGKIVSVGRLSTMKEYNLYMIEIVRTLRDMGYPVTWAVYGGGKYEDEMRSRIRELHLEDVVVLHGSVLYKRFVEVISDATLFVGMGTSVLEAALFRVPNVVAVAHDRTGVTWGSVCNLPPGSIGQSEDCPPRLKVVDEIRRILDLSPEGYAEEQESVFRHAQHHELDASMKCFMDLVEKAGPVVRRPALMWKNYLYWIMRRVFPEPTKAKSALLSCA